MTAKSSLYVAVVTGRNACSPYCRRGTVALEADSHAERGSVLTHQQDEEELNRDAAPVVALFATREEAEDAAAACLWNGWRFNARRARAAEVTSGRLVEGEGRWHSCQE